MKVFIEICTEIFKEYPTNFSTEISTEIQIETSTKVCTLVFTYNFTDISNRSFHINLYRRLCKGLQQNSQWRENINWSWAWTWLTARGCYFRIVRPAALIQESNQMSSRSNCLLFLYFWGQVRHPKEIDRKIFHCPIYSIEDALLVIAIFWKFQMLPEPNTLLQKKKKKNNNSFLQHGKQNLHIPIIRTSKLECKNIRTSVHEH